MTKARRRAHRLAMLQAERREAEAIERAGLIPTPVDSVPAAVSAPSAPLRQEPR